MVKESTVTALPRQTPFQERLASYAAQITAFLEEWLDGRPRAGEAHRPDVLMAAMRHGVLNGGKRFRPFLVHESALAAGMTEEALRRTSHVAAALEAIHCYSLIHDDLPAMDDDEFRRGKPTVHVVYGDATAILAGDALLTEAFTLISAAENKIAPETKCEIVECIATAAGSGGMVGGQLYDMAQEGKALDESAIIRTQAMKTGALIRVACESGALLAKADAARFDALSRYGALIGLIFQIADDLLDRTGDAQALGKTPGKDDKSGKQTLVSMHGDGWARARLDELVGEADDALAIFGDGGAVLREAARFAAYRDR
jgi:farnesyl diphosphate synthase